MTLSILQSSLRRLVQLAALAATALATGCTSLPATEVARPAETVPPVAASDTPFGSVPASAPLPALKTEITLAPLQSRSRLDPDQDAERSDLWQRLRDGFAMPVLEDERVQKWEQWYASRPDYVVRMTERGSRYLFHIVEEVERRGMPSELALLPFIESAFNPRAVSSARASGMWQFMPATGKDFELRQNLFRDDRRDVVASTRAALDYLQQLHKQFGDWQLALAAYNWGQGNVQRAMLRNSKAGKPTDYASLQMPDETRNYVPKLQAVKNIVADPQAFSLQLPVVENHPYFLSVSIERDIDVALAARLAGMSLEEFHQFNPQHNKPVVLAAGTPQMLLPYDNANRFLREMARYKGPLAQWTAWVAPRTVKPAEAAQLVGMSEAELREANQIRGRMVVKAGSTLLVPRAAQGTVDVSEQIADNAVMTLAAEGRPLRRVSFKAGGKGDSVAAVARRYRLNADQVALWNSVGPKARFKPGQPVVVMLPPKPATRVARSAPTKHTAKPAARTRVAQAAPR